jgi:DnaK suppressor protein
MALNPHQLKELSKRLDETWSALSKEVHGYLSVNERWVDQEIGSGAHEDSAEAAATDVANAVAIDSLDRHARELADVSEARQRMFDASYGICLDCGGDIGFLRLRAVPTAVRCISCQELYDAQHAHTPSSRL